ncbi:MAG: hypothetical protein ACRD9R_13935 [Pyrinomonadaceae bacterium]
MLRSILALVAGSITWMVTALGTDLMLMSLFPGWFDANGRVESVSVMMMMMTYSLSYSVLGGYVTGYIARRSEAAHAFALGLLQLAMGLVATIKMWDTAPAWWHVTFLLLLIPANVIGGLLRASTRGHVPTPRRLSAV